MEAIDVGVARERVLRAVSPFPDSVPLCPPCDAPPDDSPTTTNPINSNRTARRIAHRKRLLDEIFRIFVHNETSYVPNTREKQLLIKGLAFSGTSRQPLRGHLVTALKALKASINTKIFFFRRPGSDNRDASRVGYLARFVKSDWTPPDIIGQFEPFNVFVGKAYRKAATCSSSKCWSRADDAAWKGLIDNELFFVTRADKGGKTVLWDRVEYVAEATRQLSDTNTYSPVSDDEIALELQFTRTLIEELVLKLRRGRHVTAMEGAFLRAPGAEIPAFYLLPKIHKARLPSTGGYQGRPILGNCNSILKPLDLLLTEWTTPLLRRIPGSLMDTADFLSALHEAENQIDGGRLFTADVTALYPSIPWAEGIDAAVYFYGVGYHWLKTRARSMGLPPPPEKWLFKAILRLVVQRNFFHFRNTGFYHQRSGTAMGSSISVFFANAFMYTRHRSIINNPPQGLSLMVRYIDDLFFIWGGTKQDLISLISSDPLVEYTFQEEEDGSIPFLDIRVSRSSGSLKTSLYRKPTDGQQYLHFNSCHPLHTKASIPFAQVCRFRRICSDPEDLAKEISWLEDRLNIRGYPNQLVKDAIHRPRRQVSKSPEQRLRMVIPFHPNWEQCLPGMLSTLWTDLRAIFGMDPGGNPLDGPPPMLAYSRPPTLGEVCGPAVKRTHRTMVAGLL